MTARFVLCACAATVVAIVPMPTHAQSIGGCRFDTGTLRFAGTVQQTAACLLQKVRKRGSGSDAQEVPGWLQERMMTPVGFTAAQLQALAASRGVELAEVTGTLAKGDASNVRYFVIHDTSSPEIQSASNEFPANIDLETYSGNRLTGWTGLPGRVNLLINRAGRSRLTTDWHDSRTRPATKIEQNSLVPASRSLFVHVENIQPRIKPQGTWAWVAPTPGLSAAQEERLAFAYIVASYRAGRWLIPAYHFNIDQGLPNGHDDPQNMDLASWVARIAALEASLPR